MTVASRCPGRMRHWRIAYGTVGMRTPVCTECGSPNPKPLSEFEWRDLIGWASQPGVNVGDHVRTAIEAYEAARHERDERRD